MVAVAAGDLGKVRLLAKAYPEFLKDPAAMFGAIRRQRTDIAMEPLPSEDLNGDAAPADAPLFRDRVWLTPEGLIDLVWKRQHRAAVERLARPQTEHREQMETLCKSHRDEACGLQRDLETERGHVRDLRGRYYDSHKNGHGSLIGKRYRGRRGHHNAGVVNSLGFPAMDGRWRCTCRHRRAALILPRSLQAAPEEFPGAEDGGGGHRGPGLSAAPPPQTVRQCIQAGVHGARKVETTA